MRDHLDRIIDHFVEDGRIAPETASELSRELHHRPVDARQRLAEFAGYVGAGLATLGVVVVGSQVWSDIGQVLRVGVPALAALILMLGARHVVRAVDSAHEHPVRGRVVQVMGTAAAVLALLATVVALDGVNADLQVFLALLVGLAVELLVSRWAPGFIATTGVGALLFATGIAVMPAIGVDDDFAGQVWASSWMVVFGASAALVLNRFFPPEWLLRVAGIATWLLGGVILMSTSTDELFEGTVWAWVGRAVCVVLIAVGTWMFVHGGDWPWAVGAAVATAVLVGLWFAEVLNAGIALIVAGLVLIAIGAGLGGLRKATHRGTG
jgi:hypothetical protein